MLAQQHCDNHRTTATTLTANYESSFNPRVGLGARVSCAPFTEGQSEAR